MEQSKIQKALIYSNILILAIAIAFLFLNFEFISLIHAKASESLPVLVYETYSSTEVSLLYILIFLAIINILCIKYRYIKPLRPYIVSITPIIAIISILILIFNPHTLILRPNGWPPTQLDNIELGGLFSIILFCVFIAGSFFQIYLEGKIKNYLKVLGLIIVALLLSDFIHESGHALLVLFTGGEITAFYPFPVLLGGEFNAGYVGFSNVPSNLRPLVILGGEIFQWISICVTLIFLYFKPKYRKNIFILTLLIIALLDFPLYTINNSIGLPHWFLVGSTNGDIMIFSALTGFPLWALLILACSQMLLTGIIFYVLLLKNKRKNAKEDFTLQ